MATRVVRGLTVLAMLTLLVSLQGVAAPAPVRIQARPVASGPWLDRLNSWRFNAGVSILTEDATWSAGDYDHALYMVKNDLVTHYETVGTPYYTVAGDTAARDSNIYVSSSTSTTDTQAIDWWMQAPFHSMALMDPRLSQTGFGSYRQSKSGWDMGAAVDVVRGNSFSGGHFPVFFPGNGTTEPLTTFSGGEFPDPLQACSGYSAPAGLPVYVEVGGNVHTTVGPVHSFTANGIPLSHCVIDSNNTALGSYLQERGGVILIPQKPLGTGVTYTVSLTVNGVPYTWSFSIGSLAPVVTTPCTGVTATATPASSTAAGGQVVWAGAATGCPNPVYRFWELDPGSRWSMVQDYSSTNTYTWHSPGAPGNYEFEVDVRNADESVAYDVVVNKFYALTGGCTAPTLSLSPPSPGPTGASVTMTGGSSTCPNPRYRFWVADPGSRWSMVQDYSAATTHVWSQTFAPGVYRMEVDVRDASETVAYDVVQNITYTLAGCTTATLSGSPTTAAHGAGPITLTATATCPGTAQYRFWVEDPGNRWSMVQDYSTTNTYTWPKANQPVSGVYHIEVDVRDQGSNAVYEFATSGYTYTMS